MYDLEMFMDSFAVIYGITMVFASFLSIAFYVLGAIALQSIAKNRGIENSWLAWIPVGNVYILGAIADDYNLKARFKKTHLRKTLLYLMIFLIVALIVIIPLLSIGIIGVSMPETENLGIGIIVIMLLAYLALFALAIIVSVFEYIAYYRLFQSCSPKNATLFIVLSLFVSGALPIIVFICRNKNEGMHQGVLNYGA